MTVTRVEYPQAPPITAPIGTLLDAATVSDSGISWLEPGDQLFDSYNCLRFDAEAEFCAPASKDFDQAAGWQAGFRFVAYGGATCKSVGLDQARMKSEVERVFRVGESTAVERAFLKTRFVEAADPYLDADSDPLWDAPTDVTPTGGAVKPAVGLALLEGYARQHYAGLPTIHVPVTIGSLLLVPQAVEVNGGQVTTRLGSKLAIGAGYDFPNTGPDGDVADDGEKWIYATGEVLVQRGALNVIQALETSNNDVVVMAERPYVGVADCFSAAVRVQVAS